MDIAFLGQISSLGLGAVIATMVLFWKRNDDVKYLEMQRQFKEESDKRFDLMLKAFDQNTRALNSLSTMVEHALNVKPQATRKLKREND
jgi:hypothetical protein